MLGRVRNAQVKHLPMYTRPWASSSLLSIIKPAVESQKQRLSWNSINNFHPGNLGHLPSLRIASLIKEQAKTTSNFKMKGKLAIKAQTYNQDGFDSPVCVCNRLLKTLWEGLKIPKVASEPQWSILSDVRPIDNRRNLTMYHKAILITTNLTSQFVLFFTEPVQTLYKMKSDILCLNGQNPHTLAFSLWWVNRSHDVCSILWHKTYSCLDFLSCHPLLIVCRVTGDLCETHHVAAQRLSTPRSAAATGCF